MSFRPANHGLRRFLDDSVGGGRHSSGASIYAVPSQDPMLTCPGSLNLPSVTEGRGMFGPPPSLQRGGSDPVPYAAPEFVAKDEELLSTELPFVQQENFTPQEREIRRQVSVGRWRHSRSTLACLCGLPSLLNPSADRLTD